MDPIEALRRIAYLLENQRAETYKVRAFRNAAEALSAYSSEQIVMLVKTRQLAKLPGIGKTTAEVVIQAVSGKTPSYLESLEIKGEEVVVHDQAAQQLRALLRGDCHSHSDWSDGGSPIREMAEAAIAIGHEYLVLTDHSPSLTIAHGLDRERLLQQLDVLEALNTELSPFKILTGIEVDILEDGTLDQDEDLLARLDVVVASVHSKLRMDSAQMTRRMVRAVESPFTDILGHCTGRIITGRGRPESSFEHHAVFEACAQSGTAVEINSRPERRDPPPNLLKIAVELGCAISIDSDAHAPGQLEWLENGCQQAIEAGVDTENIVNIWPQERLLGWAGTHQV